MRVKIYNKTSKVILNENIIISDTFLKRLKGLMFKTDFKEGMLFKNLKYGSSIHSLFMKFTLEVYFIDERNVVFDKIILKPWKSYKPIKKAKYILEFKNKSKKRLKIDDEIELIFS